MRYRQTSIVLTEKDVQYHLERVILLQRARLSQLSQPQVHRRAVDSDDAAFIDLEAPFIDSISACLEKESISSPVSDANNDTSLLQENIQDIHGSSPSPSNDKETQFGSQAPHITSTALREDLSETEELTDRPHCDCNRNSLVDGNLHLTDRIAGVHQHADSSCRTSLLNEFVSPQASSSKAIYKSCLPYRQSRSPVLPWAPSDLTQERGLRTFRTSHDLTSSGFYHAKKYLLDLEPQERFSHSLGLFLQRSLTALRHSRHSESLQPIGSSPIGISGNTVDLRLQQTHSVSFPAAHYVEKELDFRKSLMEDHTSKPSEAKGHRRAQTLPDVQNNKTANTDDGLRVAEADNAPVASDQHKIPEHVEQGPNLGQLTTQGESVGDIFKRRMKDHRRLKRWKAWFEAQQIFINTTGEQFTAENQGQGPVLVPEPVWLHRQAGMMGEEAVRIAQQVPYMKQRPALEAQIAQAPQNDNQVAGTDENSMPALEEEAPPPLASSKQSLAEYLIFKKKPSARRRNSEPTDIKSILHLTAFENATAFRDYVDATTAELDDQFAQDDATDFGLLALRDRPVAEWGRD